MTAVYHVNAVMESKITSITLDMDLLEAIAQQQDDHVETANIKSELQQAILNPNQTSNTHLHVYALTPGNNLLLFKDRIFLPTELAKTLVLQRFHDTPLGGHQGFQTTWTILKPLFYATNFKHFVKRFI